MPQLLSFRTQAHFHLHYGAQVCKTHACEQGQELKKQKEGKREEGCDGGREGRALDLLSCASN